MGTHVTIGEAEFELNFDLGAEEPLPPGMERIEEEESWPDDTPPALVAYAHALAISHEQVVHWVKFLTTHPQGQQAWEEIRRLWKPQRRRAARTPAQARPRKR